MDVASPYQTRIDGVSSWARVASKFATAALATKFVPADESRPVVPSGVCYSSAPGEGHAR